MDNNRGNHHLPLKNRLDRDISPIHYFNFSVIHLRVKWHITPIVCRPAKMQECIQVIKPWRLITRITFLYYLLFFVFSDYAETKILTNPSPTTPHQVYSWQQCNFLCSTSELSLRHVYSFLISSFDSYIYHHPVSKKLYEGRKNYEGNSLVIRKNARDCHSMISLSNSVLLTQPVDDKTRVNSLFFTSNLHKYQ